MNAGAAIGIAAQLACLSVATPERLPARRAGLSLPEGPTVGAGVLSPIVGPFAALEARGIVDERSRIQPGSPAEALPPGAMRNRQRALPSTARTGSRHRGAARPCIRAGSAQSNAPAPSLSDGRTPRSPQRTSRRQSRTGRSRTRARACNQHNRQRDGDVKHPRRRLFPVGSLNPACARKCFDGAHVYTSWREVARSPTSKLCLPMRDCGVSRTSQAYFFRRAGFMEPAQNFIRR